MSKSFCKLLTGLHGSGSVDSTPKGQLPCWFLRGTSSGERGGDTNQEGSKLSKYHRPQEIYHEKSDSIFNRVFFEVLSTKN